MSYQEQYVLLFGIEDLIPVKWFSSDKYKSTEEIYRECVERGITWRELTGWNVDKDGKTIL